MRVPLLGIQRFLWSGRGTYPKPRIVVPDAESVMKNVKMRKLDSERVKEVQDYFNGKRELPNIPNSVHPEVASLKEPRIVRVREGPRNTGKFKRKSFESLSNKLGGLCRNSNLTSICGERAYYLNGPLASLELALIRFTIRKLIDNHRFKLVSVPDILDPELISRCGMEVEGKRTRIYRISPDLRALSGTAEMALAGYFSNRLVDSTEKVAAVSRCHRAEVSTAKNEGGGIYRVHNFTKVEMFGVCASTESDNLLKEFLDIQCSLFEDLELTFQVLDMPPEELGDPAYRKYDIEAHFLRKKIFGEISSCSNCTDFQSRRLNILSSVNGDYAHTVNGTACALPRIIMAIMEQNQEKDGSVYIPHKLRPFFGNNEVISPNQSNFPQFKYHESANFFT